MNIEILICNRRDEKVLEMNKYRINGDDDDVPDGVYFNTLLAKAFFGVAKYREKVTNLRSCQNYQHFEFVNSY